MYGSTTISTRVVRIALLCTCLWGCTRAPLKDKNKALRLTDAPALSDDLGRADLIATLESHAAFLATLKTDSKMRFGNRLITVSDYARSLDALVRIARHAAEDSTVYDFMSEHFEFYEVYGTSRWGEILLTSYFEPEIPGSLRKTSEFSAPLLRRPDDLVEVASPRYDDRLVDAGTLRGRLWKDFERKRDVLLPYYTRAEIEAGALRTRHLELCWVHPVDSFFMQIQGSGTILLSAQRRLRLGYSDQNGHLYHSIGKFLTDVIPLEKISLFTIESYLRSVPPQQAASVMNRNPSYVFFEKIDGAPKTSLGNAVFPGRTIATDTRYFPKGALAFLEFKRPLFSSPAELEPLIWEKTSRFVLDQDTGGAIRGGGRADLFWGSGDEAKRHAGFVKDTARLMYLAPKPEMFQQTAEDQLLPGS